MARTIRTKVYQFNELTEQAKQVAIEWYRTGNFMEPYSCSFISLHFLPKYISDIIACEI